MEKLKLNTVISKFKTNFINSDPQAVFPVKGSLIVVFILGATAFLSQYSTSADEPRPTQETFRLDTVIPEDESLVPIRVANYESLDQLIGQYGVVDLLSTPLNPGEKAKRVAYAVKLVRSAKSARHFSVLVPADQAHKLAGFHGEFTVIVRNPKLLGTKLVNKPKTKPRRAIVFETEAK